MSTGATTLNILGADALQAGTAVFGTSYISKDGAIFSTGITSASPGQELDILVLNGTTYHSNYVADKKTPQAPTMDIPMAFAGNSSVTVSVFDSNDVLLTNGGGAANQTSTTGATYNHKVKLQGTDKKNTQDMRCIVESTVGANVSNIVMTGFNAVPSPKGVNSKPNWYTLQGTGSSVWVYDINPIVGAETQTGSIQVISQTSKTLYGSKLYFKCFTKEWFLDSNTGKVVYDVEDSLGNAKSIAAYPYIVQYW